MPLFASDVSCCQADKSTRPAWPLQSEMSSAPSPDAQEQLPGGVGVNLTPFPPERAVGMLLVGCRGVWGAVVRFVLDGDAGGAVPLRPLILGCGSDVGHCAPPSPLAVSTLTARGVASRRFGTLWNGGPRSRAPFGEPPRRPVWGEAAPLRLMMLRCVLSPAVELHSGEACDAVARETRGV